MPVHAEEEPTEVAAEDGGEGYISNSFLLEELEIGVLGCVICFAGVTSYKHPY